MKNTTDSLQATISRVLQIFLSHEDLTIFTFRGTFNILRRSRIWIFLSFFISWTVSIAYFVLQQNIPEQQGHFLERSQRLLLGGTISLPFILLFIAYWLLLIACLKDQYQEYFFELHKEVLELSRNLLGVVMGSLLGLILTLITFILFLGMLSLFFVDTTEYVEEAFNLVLFGAVLILILLGWGLPFHFDPTLTATKQYITQKWIERLSILMFLFWFIFIFGFIYS